MLLLLACIGSPSTPSGLDGPLPFEDQEPTGAWVWIHGTVEGLDAGQVRFLEQGEAGLQPVCAYSVQGGRFEARAPLHNPEPVYVLAAARRGGDWSALQEPIRVGDQELTVVLEAAHHPSWAEGLQPPPERPLREEELRRTGL